MPAEFSFKLRSLRISITGVASGRSRHCRVVKRLTRRAGTDHGSESRARRSATPSILFPLAASSIHLLFLASEYASSTSWIRRIYHVRRRRTQSLQGEGAERSHIVLYYQRGRKGTSPPITPAFETRNEPCLRRLKYTGLIQSLRPTYPWRLGWTAAEWGSSLTPKNLPRRQMRALESQ